MLDSDVVSLLCCNQIPVIPTCAHESQAAYTRHTDDSLLE